MAKSFTDVGIVLKRRNFGEADRLVTFYTQNHGKVVALAKGVRKLTSRKKGSLEPAMVSKCHFIIGKSLPLVTQAQIITDFKAARDNLVNMAQTLQVLEIVDSLTVEAEVNQTVFALTNQALTILETNGTKKAQLIDLIKQILHTLGFGPPDHFTEIDLKNYIEDLSQRQLKSKKFLTIAS